MSFELSYVLTFSYWDYRPAVILGNKQYRYNTAQRYK